MYEMQHATQLQDTPSDSRARPPEIDAQYIQQTSQNRSRIKGKFRPVMSAPIMRAQLCAMPHISEQTRVQALTGLAHEAVSIPK